MYLLFYQECFIEMRVSFVHSVLSILLVVVLFSCQETKSSENKMEEVAQMPIAEVVTLDTTITHDFIADIRAVKNVEIRSRLNGFLDKILVDEGQAVKRGQVLFILNEEEFRTEVSRAEAQLKNTVADARKAELEADQTRLLLQKNIISETEMNLAIANLQAAESKVEEAKSNVHYSKSRLAFSSIRAPFDGNIDRILLREGSLLNEGSLLTSISDNSEMFAYFDITEQQFLTMQAEPSAESNGFEAPVSLTLANGEKYSSPAVAELAETEFNSETGTISLRARFSNPTHKLRHGASGRVNFPLEMDNITAVHQKAVFEIQDRTFVYVVGEDNTVKMTSFIAGPRVGHYYIVKEGLQPEQQVVFEGVRRLKDGDRIIPINGDELAVK